MTKEQIVEAIAKERASEAETQLRIGNLRLELAKHSDFRVGDIVGVEARRLLVTVVIITDTGEAAIMHGKLKGDGGEWANYSVPISPKDAMLIERGKR